MCKITKLVSVNISDVKLIPIRLADFVSVYKLDLGSTENDQVTPVQVVFLHSSDHLGLHQLSIFSLSISLLNEMLELKKLPLKNATKQVVTIVAS